MKTNKKIATKKQFTFEGGIAKKIPADMTLRRSVLSCLLGEDSFYEDGKAVMDRIAELIPSVQADIVGSLAIEARQVHHLRHVPLFITRQMAKLPSHRHLVADTLAAVIQRPDELGEFLSLYWKDGKCPISAQVKRGLARAFTKFNRFSLSKYNQDNAIKLRDVLFMTHAKPNNAEQAALWKDLVEGNLKMPTSWETELGKTGNNKETWLSLLAEKQLGGMAFLRNLRNMINAGVPDNVIRDYFTVANFDKVLPFRFIAAAKFAPQFEEELENAMIKALAGVEKLKGHTVLLIDVSGSMDTKLSGKSDNTRLDTACGLAILAREICERVSIFTFSLQTVRVPNRRGFALKEAIVNSQDHNATRMGKAVTEIDATVEYDRIIAFSDEQTEDKVPTPNGLGYMINVANYKNGIGYGDWIHIDGFSESLIKFIALFEQMFVKVS